MYCDITRKVTAAMENEWLNKLAATNARLADARTMQAYVDVLQDTGSWNTLSFSLRRYVYLHFTGRAETENPIAYTVKLGGRVYVFSPISPTEEISDQEKRDYADLLYRMTLQNRCFAKNPDGSWNQKAGAIQKQQYLNYLNGRRIYRKNLFPLSIALGFTTEDMEQFMNVLGESPVYNFRSAEECIYYFCHQVPSLCSMETVDELEKRFAEIQRAARPLPPAGAGMTDVLHDMIDDIVWPENAGDEEKKAAFLRFLEENAPQFTEYSKMARELLEEELYTDKLLDIRKQNAENKLNGLFVQSQGVPKEKSGSRDARGWELFGELVADAYDEPLKLKSLKLDRRLTANLPDGAHFRSALFDEDDQRELDRKTDHEHVTKKDFLMLRLYKLGKAIEQGQYSEQERLQLVRRFADSTDRILEKAGLPPIYVANPLDHMVLSALCTEEPLEFIKRVFFIAPKQGGETRGKK